MYCSVNKTCFHILIKWNRQVCASWVTVWFRLLTGFIKSQETTFFGGTEILEKLICESHSLWSDSLHHHTYGTARGVIFYKYLSSYLTTPLYKISWLPCWSGSIKNTEWQQFESELSIWSDKAKLVWTSRNIVNVEYHCQVRQTDALIC